MFSITLYIGSFINSLTNSQVFISDKVDNLIDKEINIETETIVYDLTAHLLRKMKEEINGK